MYYFIRNSEDGLRVTYCEDEESALEHIDGISGPDIRPECRSTFIEEPSEVPDPYTDPNRVLLIRGEVVIPQPVETVVEYKL